MGESDQPDPAGRHGQPAGQFHRPGRNDDVGVIAVPLRVTRDATSLFYCHVVLFNRRPFADPA
jgi:hypothetical protein